MHRRRNPCPPAHTQHPIVIINNNCHQLARLVAGGGLGGGGSLMSHARKGEIF
jgi:hypothetical protein